MSMSDDERDESPTVLRHYPGEQILHRFTLERELAGGGMGVVWLARDEELNRRIALKFLPDRVRNDLAAIQNLKSEAIKSIELAHPYIVRIYDFLYDQHNAAISMEFVDGETLSALRKARPSRVFEAYDLRNRIRQLCSALEYAHEVAEIVHRDLKPANLMVNRRDQLKVTDFGIASSLQIGKGKSEAAGGTPGYMSPQQAARNAPSVLDDVYSLGATIYDLLTSRTPFYDEERKQTVAHLPDSKLISMQERRNLLRIVGEPIPRQWEETVARCLEYQPNKRPQSIREVADMLGLMETTTRLHFQPPEAPSGLKVRNGDRRVSLTWKPSSGALSYQIKRSATPNGPYDLVGTVNESTEYSDTTVENGTVYHYVVEAANNASVSSPSGEVKGEPQAPPAPPVNLRSRVTDRTVYLEWDDATGAVRYIIKRSSAAEEPFTVIATVTTGTRFQDGGVENDVTYRYVVESVNSVGLSTPSGEFQVTPCPLPRTPQNLRVTCGDNKLVLKWQDVPSAAGYRVMRAHNSGGPFYELKTLDSSEGITSYEDKDVQNGNNYYYVVESLNAAGASPHSNEVKGQPQAPPSPPANLRSKVTDRTVYLEWDAAKGAVSYQIKRADRADDALRTIATVTTGTRFHDGGVENGVTYRYAVEAVNSSGQSTSSGEYRATPCPLPIAPVGITATPGDKMIHLSWRSMRDAVAYRVLRSETPGGPYKALITLEEKTKVEDETVKNGQTYYYVVESMNDAGISPQSQEVWAIPMPVPQIPMGIRVEAQDSQVLITWAASSNASGYNIQRSLTPGGPYSPIATVTTGTSYFDPNLENDQTYYYVLLAFNSSGYSNCSAEVSALPTAVVAPSKFKVPYRAMAMTVLLLLLGIAGWFGYQKLTFRQGVEVFTEPTGAQIIVDGKIVGITPMKTPLSAEKHTVRLVLEGYDAFEQNLLVSSNSVKKLSAILNRSKGMIAIIPKQPGRYDYKVRNSSGVMVKAGTTDPKGEVFEIETGRYAVEIDNPSWPLHVETVIVERNKRATLEPDFQPAAASFDSDPQGAEILAAGRSFGRTPLKNVMLPPGEIKIRARYPDLLDKEETLVIRRGEKNEHTFSFDYGQLAILSTPSGAAVFSKDSGAQLGHTPYYSKAPLPEGSMELVLQLNDYDRTTVPVKIIRGQTVTQTVTLAKVTAPKGTLFVEANPPNSTVILDKERFGMSGTRIEGINPGRYQLHVEHEGYEPSTPTEIEVTANNSLTPPRITLQRSQGTLQVATSDPSVRFRIREPDGKILTQGAGSTNLNLFTGSYQVEFERNFWEQVRKETKELTIKRNTTSKLEPAIGSSMVQISCDPAGADILWANQIRTTSAKALLELPAGTTVLTARHPLLGEKSLELKLQAGKTTAADFRFDYGSAQITSNPDGAEVLVADASGAIKKIGVTPFQADVLPPGPVSYFVRKTGYRPQTVKGTVEARTRRALSLSTTLEPMLGSLLLTTAPPGAQITLGNLHKLAGEPIKNLPVGTHTVTISLPDHETWQTNVTIFDNRQTELNVQMTHSIGALYIDSKPTGATYELTYLPDPKIHLEGKTPQIRNGLPVGKYRVNLAKGAWKLPASELLVERHKTNVYQSALPYGYVSVATTPQTAATLQINGTPLGTLKSGAFEVAMGTVSVSLNAKGFKAYSTNFTIGAQQKFQVTAQLEQAFGPQPGQRWTNSLGLIFVPLGKHHICITETRLMDYEVFEKEGGRSGKEEWKSPGFKQLPDHPVVNVSFEDAQSFANWLTLRERRFTGQYHLEEQVYRLPTDVEWSQAVGPAEGLYVWGSEWPPSSYVGNFSESLSYDGYEFTAPVGSFRPNRLGIYDLAGNVWEWCSVPGGDPILRGGSWVDYSPRTLKIYDLKPEEKRRSDTGFRLLIDSGKQAK